MDDKPRLIEAGFPCHQVGAETQRERDTGKAPPVNRLHVWWARRPLTPSRAAIVASLDAAATDPELFVRQLGIERMQALVAGEPWTLTGDLPTRVQQHEDGREWLAVDAVVLRRLAEEQTRRSENRALIQKIKARDPVLAHDPVLQRWEAESQPLPASSPKPGDCLEVRLVMGDPAHVKERLAFASSTPVKAVLGRELKWDSEDSYGYGRASANPVFSNNVSGLTVLDPTAGGGSIPFEALRLGYHVIANELNPVATTILYATLDYPARFGCSLLEDIESWGKRLLSYVEEKMEGLAPFSLPPESEKQHLQQYLSKCPELISKFNVPEHDHIGLIYCRQVTCPHCHGEAPLLNTQWLSKESGDPWGVTMIPYGHDSQGRGGKVRFQTYRIQGGKGPNGEDPNQATVTRGVGRCVHCKQAVGGDEIKRQARGESEHGKWQDRLYAVAAIRFVPKLVKDGQPQCYKSGERRGEIKTTKVRFFRPPNERDLAALAEAERRLER